MENSVPYILYQLQHSCLFVQTNRGFRDNFGKAYLIIIKSNRGHRCLRNRRMLELNKH